MRSNQAEEEIMQSRDSVNKIYAAAGVTCILFYSKPTFYKQKEFTLQKW